MSGGPRQSGGRAGSRLRLRGPRGWARFAKAQATAGVTAESGRFVGDGAFVRKMVMTDPAEIDRLEPAMRSLLRDAIRLPSVSGGEGPFTRFVAEYLERAGLAVDLWQSTEADLAGRHPVVDARHLPLAGRPTMVATLRGTGGGRSLLFNAHADTVGAADEAAWTHPPFGGVEVGGNVYGRGACDVKGPLVSAIWALLAMRAHPPAGDVSVELVPGEEDCVTLGTLSSVARGHTADACVVLEPTEGLPRNASRPGLRFEILCPGRAVHGTVKWLGQDAIALAAAVLQVLPTLEAEWNDRNADPLFAPYPFARPVTVDAVHGGRWQGMICDECRVGGYLELLPADDLAAWQGTFTRALHGRLAAAGWPAVTVTFPESYPGHHAATEISLCRTACAAVEAGTLVSDNPSPLWSGWAAFNSGCEAGLRANLLGTPTLVWGPGSLAQAHAADECVPVAQVRTGAERFARVARSWAVGGGHEHA